MPDTASPSPLPPLLQSFDDPLGRKIIELHVWAVGEGLRIKARICRCAARCTDRRRP